MCNVIHASDTYFNRYKVDGCVTVRSGNLLYKSTCKGRMEYIFAMRHLTTHFKCKRRNITISYCSKTVVDRKLCSFIHAILRRSPAGSKLKPEKRAKSVWTFLLSKSHNSYTSHKDKFISSIVLSFNAKSEVGSIPVYSTIVRNGCFYPTRFTETCRLFQMR